MATKRFFLWDSDFIGSDRWSRFLWASVLLSVAVQVLYAFVNDYNELLTIFKDDAFYYFVVAGNIVDLHHSTFDGNLYTNGYHPLWLLVLLPFKFLIKSDESFLKFVLLLSSVFTLFSLALLLKLMRALVPGERDLPIVLGCATAAVLMSQLMFVGMESTVAVPAFLLAALNLHKVLDLKSSSTRDALLLGLSLALFSLVRIDAMMFAFVTGLVVCWNFRRDFSVLSATLFWMAVGSLPLLFYFIFNYLNYGHLLTVSAMAKSLSAGVQLNTQGLNFLIQPDKLMALLFIVPASFSLAWKMPWASNGARLTAVAIVGYCILHFVILLGYSSWLIFRWYLFPLIPVVALGAWFLSFIIIHVFAETGPRLSRFCTVVILIALPFFVLYSNMKPSKWERWNLNLALAIKAFENQHPGRYAMGDCAGLSGYLMDTPPLQLEGLMTNHDFLKHIEREEKLDVVLQRYDIDYLIDIHAKENNSLENCYDVSIPYRLQAGRSSPKLRGMFCGPHLELVNGVFVFPVSNDALALFRETH